MDFSTYDHHRDIGPDLSQLSVTELVAEWQRLLAWKDDDEYRDIPGVDHDHGQCRHNRICDIETALEQTRAASVEEVGMKYKIAEYNECECGGPEDQPTLHSRMNFDDGDLRSYFMYAPTSDMLRSMFEDLSRLAKAA